MAGRPDTGGPTAEDPLAGTSLVAKGSIAPHTTCRPTPRRLRLDTVDIFAPAWSSDGERVYFTEGDGGGHGDSPSWLMQVARTGGTATKFQDVGYNNNDVSVSTKAATPVPSDAHDFTGDGFADVIGRTSNGDLRVYLGDGLGLSGYRRIGTGWGGMTAILTPGDFDGDDHPDVIGRLPNGDLRLYNRCRWRPGGFPADRDRLRWDDRAVLTWGLHR